MRLSRAAITLACGLGLALGGCGGSSESSSPVAGTTSRPTTTTATGAPTSTSPSRTASPAAPTHTTVSTSAAGATTSRPAAAAPSAPDGLRPGGSYSAYDNCTGACGGSVPASLLRPLHLPGGGCTPSGAHTIGGMSVLGQGPVGPAQAARQPFTAFINSRWNGARVTWLASSAYTGPILIRGRELAVALMPSALGSATCPTTSSSSRTPPVPRAAAPASGRRSRACAARAATRTRSTARASAT